MSRLWLARARSAVAARRAALPQGTIVEAWPDLEGGELVWLADEARAQVETAGPPLDVTLSVPAESVRLFYGPRLTELESLPREDSLRCRVLAGHGLACAWITLDRFGAPRQWESSGPDDPIFHLRRIGGGVVHLWRLFRSRAEAVAFMREDTGGDAEAGEWAARLDAGDWAEFLGRHATPAGGTGPTPSCGPTPS